MIISNSSKTSPLTRISGQSIRRGFMRGASCTRIIGRISPDQEKYSGEEERECRGPEDTWGTALCPRKETSFVVEEIAEVDDDDENYGQYQEDRTSKAEGKSSFLALDLGDDCLWEGGRFNEYAQARRIKDR